MESCKCLARTDETGPPLQELPLHDEIQDMQCDAWERLLELIEKVAAKGAEEFDPGATLGYQAWQQIVALPPSIAQLKTVRVFKFSASSLIRIPPEIGAMSALESVDAYGSMRLHWYPYEITRCGRLSDSKASTRTLYGNYKNRMPFPQLPQMVEAVCPPVCSICQSPFGAEGPRQYWVSKWVATDVLPLLAHVCSSECVGRLPRGAKGYVQDPHKGGLGVVQPPASFTGPPPGRSA